MKHETNLHIREIDTTCNPVLQENEFLFQRDTLVDLPLRRLSI